MPFALSHPELHELIHDQKFHVGQIRRIAERLPPDDRALNGLIGEAVSEYDSMTFHLLVIAALLNERPVDARHLVRGTALLGNMEWIAILPWKMEGEVATHLVEGVQQVAMKRDHQAAALLMAAAWSKTFREGRHPPALISEARRLAHEKNLDSGAFGLLIALAQTVDDPTLAAMLKAEHPRHYQPLVLSKSKELGETLIKIAGSEIIRLIPEKPDRLIGAGPHVRRAVARVGRNDPCPCGSGKKYKRCCEEKDRERMRFSSDVAGMTRGEVMLDRERHLTEVKLRAMRPTEIASMDVLKLPPELATSFFEILGACGFVEEAATAMEKLGLDTEGIEGTWDYLSFFVILKQRRDVAERMARFRFQDGPVPDTVRFGFRLLLASDDPARCLELIESEARTALTEPNKDRITEFITGLTSSPHGALGIHCARSLIPFIDKKSASFLLDRIQLARDRLGLPPEEPMGELLEKRFAEEVAADGNDAEELRKARERLEAKAGELSGLKEKLEQLRREVRLQEKKTPAATPTQAAVEAPELRELREKVRTLKSSIAERNNERAGYRRELGQAYADLQALREQQAAAAASNGSASVTTVDAEDALLLPGEIDTNQPPRQIEFPKRFQDTLNHLPRQVGRAALMLIGRIAAGDPSAFAGAIRLSAKPDVMRVRVGMDHRMLFRLLPECVQLVALINRRDLDKTIASI